MNTSGNKNVTETHGCIVCAKVFSVLAVYTPGGKLLDCTVTSPGGHIVPDQHQPLVACNTHTEDEIESAHKRWQNSKGSDTEHANE